MDIDHQLCTMIPVSGTLEERRCATRHAVFGPALQESTIRLKCTQKIELSLKCYDCGL